MTIYNIEAACLQIDDTERIEKCMKEYLFNKLFSSILNRFFFQQSSQIELARGSVILKSRLQILMCDLFML